MPKITKKKQNKMKETGNFSLSQSFLFIVLFFFQPVIFTHYLYNTLDRRHLLSYTGGVYF